MIIMLILSLLVSLCNLKLKSLYVKTRFIILELIIYFKSSFLKHHKPDFLLWVHIWILASQPQLGNHCTQTVGACTPTNGYTHFTLDHSFLKYQTFREGKKTKTTTIKKKKKKPFRENRQNYESTWITFFF